MPVVEFNGTDEEADTPDAAFWSVDDSGDNGFSMGLWVNVATAGLNVFLAKWETTGSQREWIFGTDASGGPRLTARDESASVSVERAADGDLVASRWYFIAMTYDGAGGANAMDGVTIYQDGASVASTASNNGAYVAMEAGTALPELGRQDHASNLLDGKVAGGPLGPWFVTHDAAGIITADQVRALYDLGRAALAL